MSHPKPLFVAPSPTLTSLEVMEMFGRQHGWTNPELGDCGRWTFQGRDEVYRTTVVTTAAGEWVFAVYPWEDYR